MAARTLSRAARSQLARQFAAPVAKRTFVSAVNAATRPVVARAAAPAQQFRGVKTVDFAGDKEVVYERSDWPREKLLVRRRKPLMLAIVLAHSGIFGTPRACAYNSTGVLQG